MEYRSKKEAFVLLADGTQFFGKSIGIEGTAFGEICFNTGMTGYQEIFTDPSYFGQIMVTTNTHIGNYGVLEDESQSKEISISGLKNKFSYCSNSVPIENPVFETLYPKSDKLSVVFDWTDVNKVLSV